jgi:hypothetical protein
MQPCLCPNSEIRSKNKLTTQNTRNSRVFLPETHDHLRNPKKPRKKFSVLQIANSDHDLAPRKLQSCSSDLTLQAAWERKRSICGCSKTHQGEPSMGDPIASNDLNPDANQSNSAKTERLRRSCSLSREGGKSVQCLGRSVESARAD